MRAGADDVAVVVIGRNEGERLHRCLASLPGRTGPVVYVDSGSTDGSVAAAEASGVHVVRLDPDRPFTAARARNAGVAALPDARPQARPRYVQFVDGDCALEPEWIATALRHLEDTPGAAVACGRRREIARDASIYNRLCDMEWNTPVGEAAACGGDSLMRLSAFHAVGGFDPTLIAGEEPDLCFRLRAAGWTVWRLASPMTRHDAAMTRLSQWWRRSVRGGWAYAEGVDRHGASAERYNVRPLRSVLVWGAAGPAAALAATLTFPTAPGPAGAALALGAAGYGATAARIALRRRRRFGDSMADAALYGAFTMLGKLPEAFGALRYGWARLQQTPATLIEYKQ